MVISLIGHYRYDFCCSEADKSFCDWKEMPSGDPLTHHDLPSDMHNLYDVTHSKNPRVHSTKRLILIVNYGYDNDPAVSFGRRSGRRMLLSNSKRLGGVCNKATVSERSPGDIHNHIRPWQEWVVFDEVRLSCDSPHLSWRIFTQPQVEGCK